MRDRAKAACLALLMTSAGLALRVPAQERPRSQTAVEAINHPPQAGAKPRPDFTGKKRVGVASFYAKSFAGRQMANGEPMDPQGPNAASRTLPLGTTAKVTNLESGKSAVITIKDRGPYVKGRLVDLSPGTARRIGLTTQQGLTKVAIAPIAVPQPDGSVKPGVAARELKYERIRLADAGSRPRVP
ncbi:MAG TPA: septal ring lytic transglycosylase RlpA family protein [Steroidobacteraceae bacterium]|nr:septal ring lytic transglycosylase RlpA family protein [Steroidobacteraceae bacterium]